MSHERSEDKPKAEEGVNEDEEMESKGRKAEAGVNDQLNSNDVEVGKPQKDCELTPEALQELIKERKAERKRKAEKRRLEDLRRIAGMKSRHGIHPVEDLFPEEIWIIILNDKDLSPRDRYNVRQVHPVFQDLLKDTEIQDILFPLVLEYKIPLVESLIQPQSSYRHRKNLDPDVKQVLNLRCVSKSIRDSVDEFIEKDIINHLRDFGRNRTVPFWLPSLSGIHLQSTNSASFLQKASAFTSGPVALRARRLFLRSLNVQFVADILSVLQRLAEFAELFQNFKDIITEFLGEVGNQILHFELDFDIRDIGEMDIALRGVPTPQVVYGLICDWLLLMPNLKWLGLSIGPQFATANNSFGYRRMPKLQALELVEDVSIHGNMPPTFKAVLLANPQVKYLSCPCMFETYLPYSDPTVLRLALEDVQWNFHSLRQTKRATETNWNVLRMKLLIDDYDVSLKEVFLFLEQNFPNLEQLTLNISKSRNVTVTIGEDLCFLRLPNLRHFVFEFGPNVIFTGDFHFFFALHFLSHCVKLESLTWINELLEAKLLMIGVDLWGHKQSERLIEFQGEGGVVRKDMSRSNIWDVFPRLKCITVKFRNYWYSIKERRGSLSVRCPEWDWRGRRGYDNW